MGTEANGKSCMLVLFEQPGGEIRSLVLLEGVLSFGPGGSVSIVHEGGALPIPANLADAIEALSIAFTP